MILDIIVNIEYEIVKTAKSKIYRISDGEIFNKESNANANDHEMRRRKLRKTCSKYRCGGMIYGKRYSKRLSKK